MDDALCVGRVESLQHLAGDVEQSIQFQRIACNQFLQRHAVKEFHGDEDTAVGIANVVDRADVGMVEGRVSTCFALEAVAQLGIVGEVVGEKLQCDKTAKASVL